MCSHGYAQGLNKRTFIPQWSDFTATKGWFPFDRCDRCDRSKNSSAIVAIYGFHMIAAIATIAEKVSEGRGGLRLTPFAPFVIFNMAAVNHRFLLECCFFIQLFRQRLCN